MAENEPTPPAGGAAPTGAQAPRLAIVSQYVKDLSFENPHAPKSLEPGKGPPQISVHVDAAAKSAGADRYEVSLSLRAEAKVADTTVFVVELTYAGLFGLTNIPKDSLQPVLLIECSRLLFPFARRIVADVTRDGGFPPLMIEPIDFMGLYRQRQGKEQAQAQAQAAAADTSAAKPQAAGNGGEKPA